MFCKGYKKQTHFLWCFGGGSAGKKWRDCIGGSRFRRTMHFRRVTGTPEWLRLIHHLQGRFAHGAELGSSQEWMQCHGPEAHTIRGFLLKTITNNWLQLSAGPTSTIPRLKIPSFLIFWLHSPWSPLHGTIFFNMQELREYCSHELSVEISRRWATANQTMTGETMAKALVGHSECTYL